MGTPKWLGPIFVVVLLFSAVACQNKPSSEKTPSNQADRVPGSSGPTGDAKAASPHLDATGATAAEPSTPSDPSVSKNPGETATPAPFCRALVNVAVDDGKAGTDYRTIELRGSGADVQVADRSGLVWHDGTRFVGLRVVHHQAKGASTVQWDELEGTDLPNGPTKVWLSTRGGLQPQDAGDGDMPFEETSTLELTSLIGPYVSAYVASGGYLGGAHDVDDSHYVTFTADGQTAKLDGSGRFVGAEGCPAIGLEKGTLTLAEETPWRGPRVLDILGVYGLAEADPDGLLESLPPAAAEVVEVVAGTAAGTPSIGVRALLGT